MDPLVDEYMSAERAVVGTQLKSMGTSLQKIREFNMKNMKVLGALVVVNIVFRLKSLI